MPPITPDDIYKQEVTKVIRQATGDDNLTINFSTGAISQHLATDKQAKANIISATITSAMLFGRYLNQTGVEHVFNNVTRQTTYSAVLVVMDRAISIGSNSLL